LQRKSGKTGRTAALLRVGQWPVWAVHVVQPSPTQGAGTGLSLQVRANHAATLEADIQAVLKWGLILRRRITSLSPNGGTQNLATRARENHIAACCEFPAATPQGMRTFMQMRLKLHRQ